MMSDFVSASIKVYGEINIQNTGGTDYTELFRLSVSFAYRVVERMNADFESKNYYEDKIIFMDEMTRLYLESKKNRRKW